MNKIVMHNTYFIKKVIIKMIMETVSDYFLFYKHIYNRKSKQKSLIIKQKKIKKQIIWNSNSNQRNKYIMNQRNDLSTQN